MTRLLVALRAELEAAGIVRTPATAGSAPPMWLAPMKGPPAPGEGQGVEIGPDATVSAYATGGRAPLPYEKWSRWPYVELHIRTRNAAQAEDIELAVTNQIIDRREFLLGADANTLLVIDCEQIIPLQMLGADTQGFLHLTSYSFQLLR